MLGLYIAVCLETRQLPGVRLIKTVVKGVELLIAEFESDGPTDGFMSVTIALMFFFTVYALEMVGNGMWFRPWVRGFLGDYAYPVSPLRSMHDFG